MPVVLTDWSEKDFKGSRHFWPKVPIPACMGGAPVYPPDFIELFPKCLISLSFFVQGINRTCD